MTRKSGSLLGFTIFGIVTVLLKFGAAKLNLPKTALIIVDVQNDFCAGGSMAILHGDDVIPVINDLRSKLDFGTVVLTKDWHPPSHISFIDRFSNKTAHPNAKLRQEYIFDLEDGLGQRSQILWPAHCIQNSTGAELRVGLVHNETDIIINKGTNPDVDSYSGFMDNDRTSETELDAILKERGVEELVVTGLVLEYCVGNTAKDGLRKGYKVTVVEDAVGCFDAADKEETIEMLRDFGIQVRSVSQIMKAEKGMDSDSYCASCFCPMCTCSSQSQSDPDPNHTAPSINSDMDNENDTSVKADMTISFSDCQCNSCTCPVCH